MLTSRAALVSSSLCLFVVACTAAPPDAPGPGAAIETDATEPEPSADHAGSGSGSVKPSHPDEAPAPEVSTIAPSRATVGSVGPAIVVTGNDFVPRSIVQLDGAPLATSFVSSTELRATLPSSKLATVGALRVSVGTAAPGGGASKEVLFTVENPAPELTALTPLSVLAGSGAIELRVSGASFVAGSVIRFGATTLATTEADRTQLVATLPAALLAASGTVPVTIVSPAPGGGASAALSFTIANPSASILSVDPPSALVGAGGLELTVNGAGFVEGSAVLFNGAALPTAFASAGRLKAQVPASALTSAADLPVVVQNPPPGGGLSLAATFRVQYPAPSLSALSPSSIAAGAGPTEVIATGSGLSPSSQITFDGAPAATTYLDASRVKATLTAAQLATARAIAVAVVNPAPGGGTSHALSLTVANGVPSVASVSPASVVMGSPSREITLHGAGFVAGSSVTSLGQPIATTYVSGGQLKATVPANHLLNPGPVELRVVNPAPGGGSSAAASLTVACDTSNVEVLLDTAGKAVKRSTNFATSPLMPVWEDAGSCTEVPLSGWVEPGRYIIVQNTTGAPVTLSAWADCTNDGKGDAFLTFYRRPTIPANDDERLGCAFWVAEGRDRPGGFASPASGGSPYCPGLMKDNGGGLPLGVCEKAVVHIQPYSYASTLYTPPPYVWVRAD